MIYLFIVTVTVYNIHGYQTRELTR